MDFQVVRCYKIMYTKTTIIMFTVRGHSFSSVKRKCQLKKDKENSKHSFNYVISRTKKFCKKKNFLRVLGWQQGSAYVSNFLSCCILLIIPGYEIYLNRMCTTLSLIFFVSFAQTFIFISLLQEVLQSLPSQHSKG